MPRPIYIIATEILKDWKNVYFGAMPYLKAMNYLNTVDDMHGADPAPMIIRYFLGNATTWRGETARKIKAELNALVRNHI